MHTPVMSLVDAPSAARRAAELTLATWAMQLAVGALSAWARVRGR